MTPSRYQRESGFLVLLCNSGEPLTIGETRIAGLVNRRVLRIRDGVSFGDGKIDFSTIGMSEIEILRKAVNQVPPEVGKSFADNVGNNHRIKFVGWTDITYVVYCQPSVQV